MSTGINLIASAPSRLETALATTESVIRRHSKTFFFATGLLPQTERRAIRSLYGFCRTSDDLVDCANVTQLDLDNWRAEVNLPSERQVNPILISWASVREEYGIDRRYESELLDGIEMDLDFTPFHTWEDLQTYCYRVAATVGLLSIPVIGVIDGVTFGQAAPFAIKLGIALQLTNILRDVGEDAEKGRVYFPQEDLQRFGLTNQDILNKIYDQRFINLMKFEIERARRLFRELLPGIALLSRRAQLAVGAAALLYNAILEEIEKMGYRVYEKRAHTTGWQKLLMLPGILIQVVTLKRPNVE